MSYLFFGLGVLVGVVLTIIVTKKKIVGTLLIDTSDPSDRPVLLLDLDREVSSFASERYVTAKVRKTKLSSQK